MAYRTARRLRIYRTDSAYLESSRSYRAQLRAFEARGTVDKVGYAGAATRSVGGTHRESGRT
jgi:hypothetical protein